MLAAPLCMHDCDVRSLKRYMQHAAAQQFVDVPKQVCRISLLPHNLMCLHHNVLQTSAQTAAASAGSRVLGNTRCALNA